MSMKIIYEPGDCVSVEDNIDAGPLAACDVKLIRKVAPGRRLAENLETSFGSKGNHIVKEIWLSHRR